MQVEEGEKVLIFKYVDINYIRKIKDQFIVGTITNFIEGSNNYDGYACTIVDEEGNEYTAFHRYPNNEYDYYFRTIEEHLSTLNEYKVTNQTTINELMKDNAIINSVIQRIESINHEKTR